MARADPTPEAAGAKRADEFLELIERGKRGKLKVYIGFAAGVGKTTRMLQEAGALRVKGVDVVLGLVVTHGRPETAALIGDLPSVPPRRLEYRGLVLEELDLEAVLARRPAVVVVDELAHTNAPGSSHERRYQDVLALVRAGINVLTAVNIQHLESLNDLVTRLTGVAVRETVPDSVLRQADQVVNIDLSVEDLRDRLISGKIYPPEPAQRALESFFVEGNLTALRELALREVADTAERSLQASAAEPAARGKARTPTPLTASSGRVLLALSDHSATGPAQVRKSSRIAGRLNPQWYVAFVEQPGKRAVALSAVQLRALADAFELAGELGAEVVRLSGRDVAATLIAFARHNGVERLLVGRSQRPLWQQRLLGSLALQLIAADAGFDVQVLSVGAAAGPVGE